MGAHVAFRHYLEDAGVVYGSASDVQAAAAERGKKRRRNRRHRNLSDLEIAETEPSAADEMPIVIQLAQNDVANIQSSWTLIEPILLKVKWVRLRSNLIGYWQHHSAPVE